uniref:Secreted protein n=1 Tax=Rhizophora mucronata TaxID=61149 RepID=A0A2P2JPE2_RHIMU
MQFFIFPSSLLPILVCFMRWNCHGTKSQNRSLHIYEFFLSVPLKTGSYLAILIGKRCAFLRGKDQNSKLGTTIIF